MTNATEASAVPLAAFPTAIVVVLAVVGIVVAAIAHRRRFTELAAGVPYGLGPLWAAKAALTSIAWWLVFAAASRWLVFDTTLSLWVWALLGGLGTETVVALYGHERRSVSRAVGATLLGARLGLLMLVIVWLTQPVWHTEWSTPVTRYVAVLIDDSASMNLVDSEASARERLEIARLFGSELAERPGDFSSERQGLKDLGDQFAAQLQILSTMGTAGLSDRALKDRTERLAELSLGVSKHFDVLEKSLAAVLERKLPLDAQAAAKVGSVQGQIKSLREGALTRLQKPPVAGAQAAGAALTSLRDETRSVLDVLARLGETLATVPADLDDAYWRALSPEKRRDIEQRTAVARSAIARQVLARNTDAGKPLVRQLLDGYALKFYRFASQPVAVPLEAIVPPDNDKDQAAVATEPAAAEKPWQSATDLAAALERVTEEIKLDELSGVLVLSDGRHNGDEPVDPVAARLRAEQIPVSAVVIGTRRLPRDAAVEAFEAPATVLVDDKVTLRTKLKLDGFRGEEIAVVLFDGETEIDRKTIKVPEDRHRDSLEFSHTAKEGGTRTYRVKLLTAAGGKPLGDVMQQNDQVERRVAVTDDRIKLLLVEAQPRWEFRYLKNLFSGPDRKVHLQYVLSNPTRIDGAPLPPRLHVSASRPYGQFEGTALPKNELEWLKFDTIVLGDIAPDTLDAAAMKSLEKFVAKRGGTLVVIAGPNFMPHAFAGTPLAALLPIDAPQAQGWMGQSPDAGYRLRLTSEGRDHVLMKQLEPATNEEFWQRMPILWWRHPTTRAKKGATVLAYAEPANRQSAPAVEPGSSAQLERERSQAVICAHRYGAGKVLALTTDTSWRLLYRVGEKYHHRFWGQVARWGVDDKLSAGTFLVRLGTDRPRYDVGQPVAIRARLMNEKGDPLTEEEVSAKVLLGDKLVHTVSLSAEADRPGRFSAELTARLDPGVYRVELSGPAVKELLAASGGKAVQTEIAVSDTKATSELVELTADDAIPERLAGATGGEVRRPVEAALLLTSLGPKSGSIIESSDFRLLDWWPLLLMFLVLGSGEWMLRKKAGLV